ncbi:MAG: hypothetical protein EBZ69_01650 [Alphaproteobacteria bacterium]|nr:hypothetical protein [Alphaproteobacteria bacterium]NDC95457.1 hypothetical protein [bacterium]NDG31626.1 hypothetical protein [bacterium]
MKVIYQFNLPEEQEERDIFDNAINYYLALKDLEDWLRSSLKYDESLSPSKRKHLEEIQQKLFSLYRERSIE